MAGGGGCQDQRAGMEIVPIELDAGMLEIIDAYCRRFGLADRGEAINELLMIGLSWSTSDQEQSDR